MDGGLDSEFVTPFSNFFVNPGGGGGAPMFCEKEGQYGKRF